MELDIHTVNADLRPEERTMIEDALARVADILKSFPRPQWHMEVEKSTRKGGIGVALHVGVATRSLFATARAGDLRSAVDAAVTKVERQAKRLLERLRRHEGPSGDSARDSAELPMTTALDLASIRDREDFTDRIGEHAARLNKVLRREIRLDPRGAEYRWAVSVPDLVEDAIAYVFEHFAEKPAGMSPDRWLVRRGLLLLDEELARAKAEKTELVGEADVALAEPREVWEELLDLPRSGVSLLEQKPADAAHASPEILADREKAQIQTAEALRGLPDRLRKSLVLRHLEGYEIPEIAYVLNAEEAQVEGWLDEAEVTMRDRLKKYRQL